MSKFITIAIGSTMSRPGDLASNLDQICAFAWRAAGDRADVLLTPELSASGYGNYPEVLATAETAGDGPIYDRLANTAARTRVAILAGFAEADGESTYLSHYIIHPDGRFAVQRKHRVTPTEAPFAPAIALQDDNDGIGQPTCEPTFAFFTIAGCRCVLCICADSGIQQLRPYLAQKGVEVLFVPTGAGGERKDRVMTEELKTPEGRATYRKWLERAFFPGDSVSHCQQYGRVLACINQSGFDGQRYYHMGHGLIINPMGEVEAMVAGMPTIDRIRPTYACASVDAEDRLVRPEEAAADVAIAWPPPANAKTEDKND